MILTVTAADGATEQLTLPDPVVGSAAGVQVVVTLTGQAPVTYDLSMATRLDDLVTPSVRQQNWRFPRAPALPFLDVFYRQDGARREAIFELTDATFKSAPVTDLPAYTAALGVDGVTVLQGSVPIHYWGARWRLHPGYRQRIRSIGDLVAQGLVPAMDLIPRYATSVTAYTPMGIADVLPYMPTTGERPDIGVVNAWAAAHIANGDGDVMDWQQQQENAEASGTIPWNYRDETGRIFSIDTHPGWSIDGRFADSSAHGAAQATAPSSSTPRPDGDHKPSLAYVPYLLTDDPYWLEQLQFEANWSLWAAGSNKGLGLLFGYQVRGTAWTLRELAHAAAATPDTTASTLLSRDYFARKLENNRRAYAAITVDSIDPLAQGTRLSRVPNPQQTPGWQNDYNAIIFAHIVQMGFAAWKPLADWVAVGLLARGLGRAASGWPRAICNWDYIVSGSFGTTTTQGELASDWASFLVAALPTLGATLPPADDALVPNVVGDGIGDYIGALRLAEAIGHAELDAMRVWVEAQAKRQGLAVLDKMRFALKAPTQSMTQPASAGDPMLPVSFTMTGPTAIQTPEIIQVIGQGFSAGQVLTSTSYGGGAYQAISSFVGVPDVLRFTNTHYAGSFLVKGVARVKFTDGKVYDCASRTWS